MKSKYELCKKKIQEQNTEQEKTRVFKEDSCLHIIMGKGYKNLVYIGNKDFVQ